MQCQTLRNPLRGTAGFRALMQYFHFIGLKTCFLIVLLQHDKLNFRLIQAYDTSFRAARCFFTACCTRFT